jgi:ABC-type Fe3+-hydroxamate transport system substrate-binding protein
MKKLTIVSLFLILALLLAACGSTEEAAPVEVTRVVTETVSEEVEVTRIVEGETIVETVTEEVEVTRIVEAPAEVEEPAAEMSERSKTVVFDIDGGRATDPELWMLSHRVLASTRATTRRFWSPFSSLTTRLARSSPILVPR